MDEKQEPDKVNASAVVRECRRQHPEWTYQQIIDYVKDTTGKVITRSTVYRAKLHRLTELPKHNGKPISFTQVMNAEFQGKYLREQVGRAITAKDIYKITRKLVDLASHGDLKATELLFNRLWGKPTEIREETKQTTTLNLSLYSNEELDVLEKMVLKASPPPKLEHITPDMEADKKEITEGDYQILED